ncbi:MAG: hypothetical protein ABI910_20950 [Gemmatimonadota bacterium]
MQQQLRLGSLLLFAVSALGAAPRPDILAPSVTQSPVPSVLSHAMPTSQDAEARIKRLKRSFECLDVGSDGMFVCSMKDGMLGSLVRKRIEPVITSTGTLTLRSVYRDRDWIYHDHVVVRIGDVELRTASLPASSPDVSRREIRQSGRDSRGRSRDDYVSERLSYRGDSDNGILQAIAQAGAAPVSMQLAGGPRLYEKKLSEDEKRLFVEAVELAALLRARRSAQP